MRMAMDVVVLLIASAEFYDILDAKLHLSGTAVVA
jgi:hypothetical protein